LIALDRATVDPVLESYVTEARRDPATFGVLLHGSRASGRHRDDSHYDLIRIVAPPRRVHLARCPEVFAQ
jgi:predicted nucleotidyltransferase